MAFLTGSLDKSLTAGEELSVEDLERAAAQVAARHLWLELSNLKDQEKRQLLNLPISTTLLFNLDIQNIMDRLDGTSKALLAHQSRVEWERGPSPQCPAGTVGRDRGNGHEQVELPPVQSEASLIKSISLRIIIHDGDRDRLNDRKAVGSDTPGRPHRITVTITHTVPSLASLSRGWCMSSEREALLPQTTGRAHTETHSRAWDMLWSDVTGRILSGQLALGVSG
ncbi:hypothetical protein WMY93_031671 [Mugilogobius chulae]|uniref:Uncharacterized protein n=1 Tax=Mugilogobius chulae TaxID=88201 RepID=A0AAW0MLN9_9GOBI